MKHDAEHSNMFIIDPPLYLPMGIRCFSTSVLFV